LAVSSAIVFPAVGLLRLSVYTRSFYWLIAVLLAGFLLTILRNYLEYRRVIYDPTWALTFQSRFDDMAEARGRAARILREEGQKLGNIENPELAGIDDVLDFFEDVGQYQRADHISPELAHHHFFHWTRGYWQAARPYVEAWRGIEPARWDHVEELFETGCDIELKEHIGVRERLHLSDSDLDTFLSEECRE